MPTPKRPARPSAVKERPVSRSVQSSSWLRPTQWQPWHFVAFAVLFVLATSSILVGSAQITACFQRVTDLTLQIRSLEDELYQVRKQSAEQSRAIHDLNTTGMPMMGTSTTSTR